MNSARVRSAYQQSEAQGQIHPVKLIHLMFERVLTHLELVEEGVVKDDAKLRGENLSKAIAIISELNVSIKEGDDSEAAEFLRGLYSSILLELPKVAAENDVKIVKQAARYLEKLKEVWEETALVEAGLVGDREDSDVTKNDSSEEIEAALQQKSAPEKLKTSPKDYGAKAVSPTPAFVQGLSVSI